jgi:hypothetical protein
MVTLDKGNGYYGILINKTKYLLVINIYFFPFGITLYLKHDGFRLGLDIMPLHITVGIQSSKWFNIF